jgi:integrase
MEVPVYNRIFRPKGSRIYRWRYRLRPEDGRIIDVSLGTSDKQVAEKLRAEKLRELEHERAGIIPAKASRTAAQRQLSDHLQDFLGDMRRRGKSDKYLANLEFRVSRLITDCGWNLAKDVTADTFQTWLRKQDGLKDKTANDYLEAARCFFNWLVKLGRAGSNPLLSIEKVKTKAGRAEEIRALSDDEMLRLLAVAGERKPVYLMAVYTGLRAGELAALTWGDLHLDAVTPFVKVRASTTKNGKAAEMRLHPELATALRESKSVEAKDDEQVFKNIPRIERFRRDLIKAGIAPVDGMGRKAVFHSLRHTFGTNLARGGVASRVAMALMRHSDRRLTDKVYTDENLLGTWGAIDSLPNYANAASSIASSFLGAEGQSVSLAVANAGEMKVNETPANIGQSHILTQGVAAWHLRESGGSGGARTRNLCRDRAAL